MRVLQIVHGFPPASNGGTEIYARDFAVALAQIPDTHVAVLTREAAASRPELVVREDRRDGLRLFHVNNSFQSCASFEESYTNPRLAAVATQVIDRVAPEVVHVQHLTCLSTGILDHLAARGIPIVMTLNDYWLICHRGQLFTADARRCAGPFDGGCDGCVPAGMLAGPGVYRAGRLARAVPVPGAAAAVRAAAKVIEAVTPAATTRAASAARLRHMRDAAGRVRLFLAPSHTMAEWFSKFGVPADRLRRVEQGIDLAPFRAIRRTPSAALRLGFAGSLIPSKAPHALLEAAARLAPGSVSVDLLGTAGAYHGETDYESRLAPLLGLPFVRKLGPVPHDRMARALADVDALVVPSEWIENAPFIIREAFAAGAPVLAADLGGMAEMVRDGVDGLLFTPGDSAALAGRIQRLIDEPELLDRLRAGIRMPMSIEDDAAAMRALYENLRAGEGSPQGRRYSSSPVAQGFSPAYYVPPRTTAIVLNYRTPDQTLLAVRSLQTSSIPLPVIVVDNGSDDGSAGRLRAELADVPVIETGRNLGFSGGCNVGIRMVLDEGAPFVLLVNSDVVLAPEAVEILLGAAADHPSAGIVGAVLLGREEPDRIASAGMRYSRRTGRMRHVAAGYPMSLLPPGSVHAVDAVSGCVMLIRREVFERIGLFDEEYFFFFEDVDVCLRARDAGFEVIRANGAVAYHEGGRSIGRRSPDRVYFATRNHLRLARRAGHGPPPAHVRAGLVVALNAAYVLLSGETPKLRGLAAVARGAWHHVRRRYGPA
jgi:GT2 family glycosyltransferase/glycosyltransferase involved in cell wall biosynthesis